jgi:hypothetical protein
MNITYLVPFFFRYQTFRDLKFSYMIGVGIDDE